MTRRSMTLPMLPNLTEYAMVASVRSNHAGAQALIQLLRSLVASVTVHLCSWQHSFRFWETSPASMFSHCHPSRLLLLSQRHQPITPSPCEDALLALKLTPDIIPLVPVDRLCSVTGAVKGRIRKLQVFCSQWEACLKDKRAHLAAKKQHID